MATRTFNKSGFQIEWFNVTYRSVILAVVVLGGALAAGYVWFGSYAAGPRNAAAEALARATTALARTEALRGDERLEQIRANARAALDEGRTEFDRGRYDDARIAAIRSENLSQKAVDLAGGTESRSLVRFYRLEGDVRVKRAGEFAWESATNKMVLDVGDQVKTSSSASAQLIYFDGTLTTIEPGSLLEIRDLYEDPVTKVRRVREKLNWGEVLASTQKRNVEGSFHEVVTDKATAQSRDEGAFRVAYDKQQGTSAFDVFQGKIEVSTPKRKEHVVAGERVRTGDSGKLSAKELLPGVPRLISPSDQKVFAHENPGSIKVNLSWERIAGASRYDLEISDRPLFAELLYDAERRDSSALIDGVAPGDYYWRVAAISRAGVRGPFSDPRRFRVSSQKIRDREDTIPPALEITGFVAVGPMLIINGHTEPGASLWVENERVDVSEDGSFYSVLRLKKEGVSQIRLVAQDNAGNERVLTRPAFVESY